MSVSFVDRTVNAQQVLSEASRLMKDRYRIHDCTIQVEEYTDAMNDCSQCQDPKD